MSPIRFRQENPKPIGTAALIFYVATFPILEGASNSVLGVGTVAIGVVVAAFWALESLFLGARFRTEALPLLLFVAFAVMTLYWSGNVESSISRLTGLALVAFFYIMLTDVTRSPRVARKLTFAYVLGVSVMSVTSISSMFSGEPTSGLSNRFSAVGFDPNSFGLMAVSVVPLAVEIGADRGFLVSSGAFVVAIASSLVAIGSGSRAALISLGLVWIAQFAVMLRKGSALRIIAALVIGGVALWWGLDSLVPEGAIQRVTSSMNSHAAMADRGEIWKAGLEKSLEHPVIGFGYGTFTEEMKIEAHNTFVAAFFETGLFGLLLWTAIWVVHGNSLRKLGMVDPRFRTAYAIAFIPIIAAGMTLNWQARKPLYLLWGIIAGLAGVSSEFTDKSEPKNYKPGVPLPGQLPQRESSVKKLVERDTICS